MFTVVCQLADTLGLQFDSNKDLNRILDMLLPPRSAFIRRTKRVGGEKHVLYMRDSLSVLRELYGRPDFAKYMVFAPEKHYVLIDGKEERWWSEMHTGRWWWKTQVCLRISVGHPEFLTQRVEGTGSHQTRRYDCAPHHLL